MTIEQLIVYIRESCLIDDPSLITDTEFLALDSEQIFAMLSVAHSRVLNRPLSDELDVTKIYPITLLTKREVYFRLALKYATAFNVKSDSGAVELGSKFEHFQALATLALAEYEQWYKEQLQNRDITNTNAYGNSFTQNEVFIGSRYATSRNYMHSKVPTLKVTTSGITTTSVNIEWELLSINKFDNYRVYLSKKPIVDLFSHAMVDKEAQLLHQTWDIHSKRLRASDLEPNTIYYLAVLATEVNTRFGYDEVQFITLEV